MLEEVKEVQNEEEVAAPKAKKAKAKKEGTAHRRSKFTDLYPKEAPLTVLVTENPKKAGSKAHARFEHYAGVSTVGEALTAGVTYQDIAYNVGRKFIAVGEVA